MAPVWPRYGPVRIRRQTRRDQHHPPSLSSRCGRRRRDAGVERNRRNGQRPRRCEAAEIPQRRLHGLLPLGRRPVHHRRPELLLRVRADRPQPEIPVERYRQRRRVQLFPSPAHRGRAAATGRHRTEHKPREYTWDTQATDGKYAFSIYSNDGFVRSFAGQVAPAGKNGSSPRELQQGDGKRAAQLTFTLHNDGSERLRFTLTPNDYTGKSHTVTVPHGKMKTYTWPTQDGYYDVVITVDTDSAWTQRYAGRIATTD